MVSNQKCPQLFEMMKVTPVEALAPEQAMSDLQATQFTKRPSALCLHSLTVLLDGDSSVILRGKSYSRKKSPVVIRLMGLSLPTIFLVILH